MSSSDNSDKKISGNKRKRDSAMEKSGQPNKRFRREENQYLQVVLSCFHDDTTESDIRLFFEGCGNFVSLVLDEKNGQATLEFEDEVGVENALKKHLKFLKDIPVSVVRKDIPTKVLCENLYWKTTDEELLDFFVGCGNVTDYNINKRKRVAVIEFENRKSADLATRRNGKKLGGRILSVKFYEEKDEKANINVDSNIFQFSY